MDLFNRFISAPTRLVGGYLPRKQPAVQPVQPVQPVSLDVPSFMKKPAKPVEKPVVRQGKQSFAEILAEAERILR
ncbi:hypothetical protein D3C76_855920 [compost metagenome]